MSVKIGGVAHTFKLNSKQMRSEKSVEELWGMEMRVRHKRLVQMLIKEGYKVFTWGGPVFGGLSRGIVLISEKLRTGFAMRYDFVNALSKVGLPINWYTQEDFCYESVGNN